MVAYTEFGDFILDEDDDSEVGGWQSVYDTERTKTIETVLVCKTGLLSIKIVETANGHKREVFAGFSEVKYDSPSRLRFYRTEIDGSDTTMTLDHKYPKALRRAAEKWMAPFDDVTWYSTTAIIKALKIEENMSGRVEECFIQAFGRYAMPLTLAQQEARDKQDWALKEIAGQSRAADQLANDPTFGMF